MDKMLIKIIEEESLRTIVITLFLIFVFYIFYHIFIKKYVEDLKNSIENFTKTMNANNEATKIVIFYELQREYYEKKEKGGKSINADSRWQDMWKQYVDLGDGKGDTLKKEWDALPII